MFFDGWVTSLLYLSRVFFVSSRAFAIDACALLPALMKRSVSLMPWVRLLSALCAGAVCAAAISGVARGAGDSEWHGSHLFNKWTGARARIYTHRRGSPVEVAGRTTRRRRSSVKR